MREILFRGRRRDTGEWVYGDLLQYSIMSIIQTKTRVNGLIRIEAFPVDPESVAQHIGRKDNNGRRIFEGDILLVDDVVCGEGGLFLIRWNEDWNGWDANMIETEDRFSIEDLGDMKIVGNRWDTPNLLGGLTEEGPDR